MELTIVVVYTIIDDPLILFGHRTHPQAKMSDYLIFICKCFSIRTECDGRYFLGMSFQCYVSVFSSLITDSTDIYQTQVSFSIFSLVTTTSSLI